MNKLRLIALFTTIAMSVAMMVSCGDVKDKNKDSFQKGISILVS